MFERPPYSVLVRTLNKGHGGNNVIIILNGVEIVLTELDKCSSSITESQAFVLNYNVNTIEMTVWL